MLFYLVFLQVAYEIKLKIRSMCCSVAGAPEILKIRGKTHDLSKHMLFYLMFFTVSSETMLKIRSMCCAVVASVSKRI